MRRVAKPENFLLHFGRTPEAKFHRQIAARDHHGERTAARSFDDQLRQVLDAKPRLDLQHDRQQRTVRASADQLAVEQRHVRGVLHEGEANQVRVLGDKVEGEEIVLGAATRVSRFRVYCSRRRSDTKVLMGTGSLCPGFRRHGIALGVSNMRTTFFKTCGVSIATLALGLSFLATPVMAAGAVRHGGGAGFHGGGGWHGGGAGFHGGGGWHGGGGGWHGGGSGWRGGGGGWNGGYGGWNGGYGGGYGNGYGYGAAALGLGLLGGAIIGSQYPYYDSGYATYPQDGGVVASCASRFKSYDPASGTYLGYDGLRHPCP